ncbi:phytoene desaturase family protein [Kutzneria sp. CA-103260]|uniref:phytoene desaturase family protein n=1 Tax=Kutzneria sp. CA-103260 TaxID=2802641 RepID=UPI001BED6821|nr:NAD(P)/FAD-dependent oxidoreductase [Kutzneria sp. CA-103260]QUQ67671.1 oxidoreductase [Kutzneria sp. CA-103260]
MDVVIVGGGHNGLVAAAYLARAGKSVLVLERLDSVGGAAVSSQPFPGVDVRLSRYSYLVSLLPRKIITDLDLPITLLRRRMSSYTPVGSRGLLIDTEDPARTSRSFVDPADFAAWQRFYVMTTRVAERVFPTLTEPLPNKASLRAVVDDDEAWQSLFEEPISSVIERNFRDDTVRGVVLTDALIGTFASADDPSLLQNRCFLYHVIGNGTGSWDVPVGGMGSVTAALSHAALSAGAQILTGATVTSITPDGEVSYTTGDSSHTVRGSHVLVNASPAELAHLLGSVPPPPAEGAQLKVNMVLRRLPRLLDSTVDPRDAFGGTFHVNESYSQLAKAFAEASAGQIPSLPPCEIYCHSLTDPSIIGSGPGELGLHTLTLFGLHMPARLFTADNPAARSQALSATLASLNQVLAEPIESCLLLDPSGHPCLEAKTPVDLEDSLRLPGGHIFHRDLSWPYSDDSHGSWGVETPHPRILLCGAGALRGGGVSGIPGHNAAMKILTAER